MKKYYIIAIVICLLFGVGNHFIQRSIYNNLVDKVKEDIEEEKQLAIKEKDTLIMERDNIINDLIKDNERAKQDSRYWYNMAKRKSFNPNYNIDFLTAADEISRSEYQPGKANSNIR